MKWEISFIVFIDSIAIVFGNYTEKNDIVNITIICSNVGAYLQYQNNYYIL